MKFKLEDVPFEVQYVWVIEWAAQPIGKKTLDKIKEIINKYPE